MVQVQEAPLVNMVPSVCRESLEDTSESRKDVNEDLGNAAFRYRTTLSISDQWSLVANLCLSRVSIPILSMCLADLCVSAHHSNPF